MKTIKKLVHVIDDELDDAQMYAEKMVDAIASNDSKSAEMFHQIAEDEMRHATQMHQYTVDKIDNLRKMYTPPADMIEKWETSHNAYMTRAAQIKQMLSIYNN